MTGARQPVEFAGHVVERLRAVLWVSALTEPLRLLQGSISARAVIVGWQHGNGVVKELQSLPAVPALVRAGRPAKKVRRLLLFARHDTHPSSTEKPPGSPNVGWSLTSSSRTIPAPCAIAGKQRLDLPRPYVAHDFLAVAPHEDFVRDVDGGRHALPVGEDRLVGEADAIQQVRPHDGAGGFGHRLQAGREHEGRWSSADRTVQAPR